jgi:4-hydroxy-tetrahydrodipicolinate synthase
MTHQTANSNNFTKIFLQMSLSEQLGGTGVALVTPFTAAAGVDFDALGRLIDFVIEGGVNYLVTLGTTGETATLTENEKKDIIKFTYDKAAGRVPVVVGIGGNNTQEVLNDLKTYPLDGAVAVLSASPYYSKPSQEGIYQHYKAMAAVSPRPILLYNVPGRTASNLTAETTLRLAQVPNIAGIKEASGHMVQCMHILRDKPADFLVTSGDDHLTLPLIACGMAGVISVAANCFPADFSQMVRHCLHGDFAAARPLHYKCLEGNDLLFAENNPAGVKAFLAELGIIQNVLRLPLVPLSEGIHQKVKAYLAGN